MSKKYDNALHLMEVQGGSFIKSLAHCYLMADPINRDKLRDAFEHHFRNYEERFAAMPELEEIACSGCFRYSCKGECMGE